MTPEEKRLWNESFLINKSFLFIDPLSRKSEKVMYSKNEYVMQTIVYHFVRKEGRDYIHRESFVDYFVDRQMEPYKNPNITEPHMVGKIRLDEETKVLEVDLTKVNVVKIPSYDNAWVFSYSGEENCPVKEMFQKDYDFIIAKKIELHNYYEDAKLDRDTLHPPGFINPKTVDYTYEPFMEDAPASIFTFINIGKLLFKIGKHVLFNKKKK